MNTKNNQRCRGSDIRMKSAMLEEMEERLSGELIRITKEWDTCSGTAAEDFFVPYTRFIKEHQYFYRTALTNRKSLPVKKSFQPLWERICRLRRESGEDEAAYFFLYFQSGVTMVLRQRPERQR